MPPPESASTQERTDEVNISRSERNPATGWPHPSARLLDDYAAVALRRSENALERTAIRTRSFVVRDLIAHLASSGKHRYRDLADTAADLPELDPRWAASLGRVVALQNLTSNDRAVGIALLARAVDNLPDPQVRPYLKLLAELHFDGRDFERARDTVEQSRYLSATGRGYLRTDVLNPNIGSPFADKDEWTRRFRRWFERAEVQPPEFEGAGRRLRDLRVPQGLASVDGPLISVVMTTFRPSRQTTLHSARSILAQTWSNLELIVVDDASGPEFGPVIDEIAALDPRVRVVRLASNGGTYLARNAGLRAAAGVLVTGQDDDDWSLPERIARQADSLLRDVDVSATMSRALTADDDLVVQRPGYGPASPNTSSMMYRRDDALAIGGFLPSRRAADTEFHLRLAAWTGKPSRTLAEPLAVVRIRRDSLSRSDFRAGGWQHESRRAFRDAYTYWHRNSDREELALSDTDPMPIPVPERFRVEGPRARKFDVIFAGDWHQFGGPQRSMYEEISALDGRGLRIGIMHLDAMRFMSNDPPRLCSPASQLIHDHVAERVIEDDVATARLLILRYPPILQFPAAEPSSIRADQLIIVANQAPSERDGSDIRYDVTDVSTNAERVFGTRALWVPQGPTVRSAIESLVRSGELADYDMPGILDINEWRCTRKSFRSDRPIIGRHSRDNSMKWPDDPATLLAAYPDADDIEVRVMGGTLAATEVLGRPSPVRWISFAADELDVRTFLNSIDFFVYHQHPHAYDAFGRAVLEALATGCVAILPGHMRPTFGDAALYATPEETRAVVTQYYSNPGLYQAQSDLAVRRVSEWFSRDSFAARVESLLREPSSQ